MKKYVLIVDMTFEKTETLSPRDRVALGLKSDSALFEELEKKIWNAGRPKREKNVCKMPGKIETNSKSALTREDFPV